MISFWVQSYDWESPNWRGDDIRVPSSVKEACAGHLDCGREGELDSESRRSELVVVMLLAAVSKNFRECECQDISRCQEVRWSRSLSRRSIDKILIYEYSPPAACHLDLPLTISWKSSSSCL